MEERHRYSLFDFVRHLDGKSPTGLMDVRVFLSVLLQRPVAEIFADVSLTDHEYRALMGMLLRRAQGEPVAYIVGQADFWGLTFFVGPGVLVPRPDTECLIETVLSQHDQHTAYRCLDLGMGCGVLALTLAHCYKRWQIDAVERSEVAMTYAKRNQQQFLSVADRVRMWQADWQHLPNEVVDLRYDVVVSNPPYIAENDLDVSPLVHRFEPHEALYSAQNGLADLQDLAKLAKQLLRVGGCVYFEHGHKQGALVQSILEHQGFCDVATVSDIAGSARVTWGRQRSVEV